MPELPEVETVVSELNKKLKGKTIKSVEVNMPKMVSLGPGVVSNIRKVESHKVIKFIKLLEGQKITSVKRRAKLLIFNFSPISLKLPRTSGPLSMLVHLKMTGQFIYEDEALRKKSKGRYRILNKLSAPRVQLPTKHTHAIFRFTDKSVLYYNDLRQFGYLKVVKDSDLPKVKDLSEFGPEPLSKEFTLKTFIEASRRKTQTSIKQLLMDPKVVVGIGNIYSDEILFHAKIKPDRKVKSLSGAEFEKIYKQIRPVLKKAIQAKGSSVGDFIRTDGSWGRMGKYHFVYGRKGKECKICGSIIKSTKLGGRTSSFCPKCQV